MGESFFPEGARCGIHLVENEDGTVTIDTTGEPEAVARVLLEAYIKFNMNALMLNMEQVVTRCLRAKDSRNIIKPL